MPAPLKDTRHFKLARELRERVARMDEGEFLPTQRELKQQYKVSQATLDRALSRLVNESLIYRPSGKQRLVRSAQADPALHRVTIIRPDYPSPFIEGIMRAMVDAGRSLDWAFEIVYYRQQDRVDISQAIGDSDGGAFIPDGTEIPESLRKALLQPRQPVAVINQFIDGVGVPCISCDHQVMVKLAVDHLLAFGHNRIAILAPCLSGNTESASIRGWQQALEEAGIEPDSDLIIDTQPPKPFGYRDLQHAASQTRGMNEASMATESAYRAVRRWLGTSAADGCTAIFASTYDMSIALLRALREQGRSVPDDVSVVGADGVINLGEYLAPPLTVVTFDLHYFARTIIHTFKRMLEGREGADPSRRIHVHPFIIERESCRPVAEPLRRTTGESLP